MGVILKPRATPKKPAKGKVLEDGTLMLFGIIGDSFDGLDSATVVEQIRKTHDQSELTVLINSPGGYVTDGLAIHHELAMHPGNVVVEITGVAASMASAIAMAGKKVRMSANALVMIHDPWNVAVGNSEDLRKAAELLDKFGTTLLNIYVKKTGLPEDEVKSMMAAETWLNADEALEKGFVDEVVEPVEAAAFADLDVSELGIVPAALTALIREGRKTMAKKRGAAAEDTNADPDKDEKDGEGDGTEGEGEGEGEGDGEGAPKKPESRKRAAASMTPAQIQAAIAAAVTKAVTDNNTAEQTRQKEIRAVATKFKLGDAWALQHIESGATSTEARAGAADKLVEIQAAQGHRNQPSGVVVNVDERDTFRNRGTDWILMKSGYGPKVATHTGVKLDPGQMRGMRLIDMARESLENQGISTRGMSAMAIAKRALYRGGPSASGGGSDTSSDFPVLLENSLNKLLQASYALQPTRWREIAAEGSVSDFREHKRLRRGSLGSLQDKLESGEFRQIHIPDGEKGVVQAGTKGVIVGITRQAIVNDDVGAFLGIMGDLGQSVARSIEQDVFNLLKENSGLGPTIGPFRIDGDLEGAAHAVFYSGRSNIDSTAEAPSVDAFERMRVIMSQQKDPQGEDFLDLRPNVWVGPVGLGSVARVVVEAEFDFEANMGSTGSGLFNKPNRVRGIVSKFVDSPRLTGTRYYLLADPSIAPIIEVVFLDGETNPVMEVEESVEYDGVKWLVRHDWGVGATDFRGGVTNAGA